MERQHEHQAFAGSSPPFLPEHFFATSLEGWGIIETPFGGLRKRYTLQANGAWDGQQRPPCYSPRTWRFDDGRSETLDWRICKLRPGCYSGVRSEAPR